MDGSRESIIAYIEGMIVMLTLHDVDWKCRRHIMLDTRDFGTTESLTLIRHTGANTNVAHITGLNDIMQSLHLVFPVNIKPCEIILILLLTVSSMGVSSSSL